MYWSLGYYGYRTTYHVLKVSNGGTRVLLSSGLIQHLAYHLCVGGQERTVYVMPVLYEYCVGN